MPSVELKNYDFEDQLDMKGSIPGGDIKGKSGDANGFHEEDSFAAISDKLKKYDQTHLLKFYDKLSPQEQSHLLEDISHVDFEDIKTFFDQVVQRSSDRQKKEGVLRVEDLSPVPKDAVGSVHDAQWQHYYSTGLSAVASNSVCVLLLAGGQGTRLGVPYPKGMFDIGLPSKKTLYQIQAERILKIQQLADAHVGNTTPTAVVTWYIMTSEHTKSKTAKFFQDNNYFGLQRENIEFFEQNMTPCIDTNGKILLESKYKLARAPDGNGGLYKAMKQCNVVSHMQSRGIKHIHIYGVDNILVKMADPAFIGFCISKGADCGNKVLPKRHAHEKVGVVCKVEDHYRVVEYSEIPQEMSELKDETGKLVYNAGNIVNHYLTFDFIQQLCANSAHLLPYHEALKKIPCIDMESGVFQENPDKNTGIKREHFVFDVFPHSKNFAVFEVERESEFAPLKNADSAGIDCPKTSRSAVYNLHAKWIQENGATISTNTINSEAAPSAKVARTSECDDSEVICEISPLVSYGGEVSLPTY